MTPGDENSPSDNSTRAACWNRTATSLNHVGRSCSEPEATISGCDGAAKINAVLNVLDDTIEVPVTIRFADAVGEVLRGVN